MTDTRRALEPTDSTDRRATALPSPVDDVRRSVLPNGVRVLTDTVPGAPSVTLGVWVGVGGRDEDLESSGSSHFLEHLLFKGTERRSALDIALDIDGVGGDMNAYTSNEYTAYFARVPAPEYPLAAEVLLDVVTDPALRPDEVEGERGVILEELAAADDDPEDVVAVKLFEALFPEHPLGREVLGTEDSIASLERDHLADFFEHWYAGANLVVTGSGAIDHDRLVADVAAAVADRPAPSPMRQVPGAQLGDSVATPRPVDLVQVALGWRAPSLCDDDRFALSLLNHVLGSGPSSRLFQQVREQRGLTYSIASSVSQYVDAGALTIGAGCSQPNAAELLRVVLDEVAAMAADGVSEAELARAKRSLRGSILLGLEDSSSRAARLGISETLRGHVTPLDEQLRSIDAVSVADVAAVAHSVLSVSPVLSVVGPGGLDSLLAIRR